MAMPAEHMHDCVEAHLCSRGYNDDCQLMDNLFVQPNLCSTGTDVLQVGQLDVLLFHANACLLI